MALSFAGADLAGLADLRSDFLEGAGRQVVRDAYHRRGWSDLFRIDRDGKTIGYGALLAEDIRGARDLLFELHLVAAARRDAPEIGKALLAASGARGISCQSNDPVLAPLLFSLCASIRAEGMLFEARAAVGIPAPPGVAVRPRRDDDAIFEHTAEPVGQMVVEADAEIVATAGWLTHYNPPWADIHMEVRPDRRQRGFGTLAVAGAIAACRMAGFRPAARCGIGNWASRSTLMAAGMRPCGFLLQGRTS